MPPLHLSVRHKQNGWQYISDCVFVTIASDNKTRHNSTPHRRRLSLHLWTEVITIIWSYYDLELNLFDPKSGSNRFILAPMCTGGKSLVEFQSLVL